MKKNKTAAVMLCALLTFTQAVNISAKGVYYLPDVTAQMSSPSYWTDEKEVLMTYEEIEKLNSDIISRQGTNMFDLKNQAEVVDGIALNESVKKSSQADASY